MNLKSNIKLTAFLGVSAPWRLDDEMFEARIRDLRLEPET